MGSMRLTSKTNHSRQHVEGYVSPTEPQIQILISQVNYAPEAARKLTKHQAEAVIGAHFERNRLNRKKKAKIS